MEIISKEILYQSSDRKIIKINIKDKDIALKAKPGQFVIVMPKKESERIPLTIVDSNLQQGFITLIFQEAGFTTKVLAGFNKGDSVFALAGPLGRTMEVHSHGKVGVVGGGVGIAEIYPVLKSFKGQGDKVFSILGARTKDLLILKEEISSLSDKIFLSTDDGSLGFKGMVTTILEEVLLKEKLDLVYAVGPIIMMKSVTDLTRKYNIPTIVSLNTLMVDGTGMCGCCRVSIDGHTKFACIDGPEFNAFSVNWQELINRNNTYLVKEKHICNLNNLI